MSDLTPQQLVDTYLAQHFRCVFWPQIGDAKGPREEGWPKKTYTATDYRDGYRVGIMTGHEVTPGHFLHDVDLDWAPGAAIALKLLPATDFAFGRASKKISHCFYTLPEALVTQRYEDIDKTCLIELRGVKSNGDVGFQTMVPPSIWTKDGKQEPLLFTRSSGPTHVERAAHLKQRVCLSAIGMLLAKYLGHQGFRHEARLCIAGFLLRANLPPEDVIALGEAIASLTGNEVSDVRQTVLSTVANLAHAQAKVRGGPSLIRILGDSGKAVVGRINEWLGRDSDFIRDQHGRIIAKNQNNIRRAVELLGYELSCNDFTAKLLLDGLPLEDKRYNSLYLEIEQEYHFQPPNDYCRIVVEDMAWKNNFHPVKQYLNALVWDGKPRLDTWLIRCAAVNDSEYTRTISSIMLIAAVRRIRQPGCKYDEMVVWESSQGADKSSAAQALCPQPEWFSDDLRLNLHSQQLIEATLGKWIIEASDLAGRRKTELEQLKAMLSRQVDGPARMAYAHFPVERPRHFIIIGTTNSSTYLSDPSGGRRFWPMKVQRFNIDLIKLHRDQLWAEACVREAKGESIRLAEPLWPVAAREQEKRRDSDAWEDAIRQCIVEKAFEGQHDTLKRITMSALWLAIGVPLERRDIRGSARITDTMQRLGFRKSTVRPTQEEPQIGYIQENPALLDERHED